MQKIIIIICLLLPLLFGCKGKKSKVTLTENSDKNFTEVNADTIDANSILTPELFFKITLEINKLSEKYKIPEDASRDDVNKLMEKRAADITEIYKKYSITETQFEQFSETHYRELDSYLQQNPKIDEKLGQSR